MVRLSRRVATLRLRRDRESNTHWLFDHRADDVIVEEPLEVRSRGQVIATTMRTPGHDIDFIHGYLFSEGLIERAEDIREARYCPGAIGPGGTNTYNVVEVELSGRRSIPMEFIRSSVTTSACGVCGSSSAEQIMARRGYSPVSPITPPPDLLVHLPQLLRTEQKAFRRTGGVHAAGVATTDGQLHLVREDVGRHNAADKIIGAMLRSEEIPASGKILVMSSRASFELVQKAVLAGFSGLVAVSAATSAAVELARSAGLLLVGFTRDDRCNIYSGDVERI
ncbi:formate dehydrogenase accessory sulfurtransferase FdhD [Corynebacterium poyangense]|uniref:Sulfur carrier protein FdhD n=1 Tax=Corynebacterium poyangense TaxID=2684405 RepID=A0A7H0SM43_9CORY|nr:formate dehydrogenase accessory sulfurtransferase FdhD [Corynebacterium poyangense]MBZ8176714.1 formate dehydrogenase accessory sulfurtransferase FdhD [Corynebacterium poyangense]QNQ89618.1 formate dehydrogenase accessory sulfurtransferase FdhD [Corynebacterium poyangense]